MKRPCSRLQRLLPCSFLASLFLLSPATKALESSNRTWTLATEDTELTLTVSNNAISIVGLRNPEQKWNWIAAPMPVPMPAVTASLVPTNAVPTNVVPTNVVPTNVVPTNAVPTNAVQAPKVAPTAPVASAVNWEFRDAAEESKNGHQVTLRFTCANPAMELKSVWSALPGPGPVENEVSVENKSSGDVTFAPTPAAAVSLVSDAQMILHWAEKTSVGPGKVQGEAPTWKSVGKTGSGTIPLLLINAGMKHGAYLGFEWELGGFTWDVGVKQLNCSVLPITQSVTRSPGDVFRIPSVYYGTYQGDLDDGGNRFKRWFWNHKITRSLHDNKDEPWVEVCAQEIGGKGSSSVTGKTPQAVYDHLAAVGAECVKMDFWDGSKKGWYTGRDWMFHPEVWPDGFDFAAKAHKAGLKAALYMGGTYNDADLNTTAGRDAELAAVQERYDKGWFDMWRTDRYEAPKDPMPDTYEGVANFLYIQDRLIKGRPGYHYENCCNGGKYKGFAICRRMTFCTMNDNDSVAWITRTTYFANSYAINPVQLKSDHGPATDAYDLRTDMLGSVLTWAVDNPVYRQHIALYKEKQRPILRGGNVYHILPMPNGWDWDGMEYYNPDLDKGSVFLFKPSALAFDGDEKIIKLKGLDRSKTYTLSFQDRTNLNCTATGAKLMDEGIRVSGMAEQRASEIIWIDGPGKK